MILLYRLLLIALSPLIILWARRHPALRQGLRERLGIFDTSKLEKLKTLVKREIIWLHGVSVGETKVVLGLLDSLRQRVENISFLVTTTTPTGMQILRSYEEREDVLISYFPLLDIPFATGRFLKLFKPRAFLAVEAEAWPNLLYALGSIGASRILVNARLYLGGKSSLVRSFYSRVYRFFDKILCQNETALKAFLAIGIPSERLQVTGNIKHQQSVEKWTPAKTLEFKEKFGWRKAFVIVAGSTHPKEEPIVLSAFEKIKLQNENAVLALVPRHPERGKEVLQLARKLYFKAQRFTYYNEVFRPLSVLVVDEMGLLPSFYQIADVVILGGTFDEKVGGHNIVEPISLKKPVIVGPYVDAIAQEVETLAKNSALLNARDEDELFQVLSELMRDVPRRNAIAEAGFNAIFSQASSIDETVGAIVQQLKIKS